MKRSNSTTIPKKSHKTKKSTNIEILTTMAFKTTKVPAKSKRKPPTADKTLRVSFTKDNQTHYINSSFQGTEAGIHWRIFDPANDENKCGLIFNFTNNSVDITAYKADINKRTQLPTTKKLKLTLKKLFSLIMQGKLK